MESAGVFLYVINLLVLSCNPLEEIKAPSDVIAIVLPGSTVRLNWTFSADPSKASLAWFFTRRRDGSKEELLARKYRKNFFKIVSWSLPSFEIELTPATLVLKNVDERYNGKYRFSVQALVGGSNAEVELYIAAKPNVTFTCLSLNEVNEGDNFTCVCKGENGNPPANVIWYKDGVQIGRIGEENKTLTLINVNETSNGTYKCEAQSNSCDSFADKKSIKLVVRRLNKPNITSFTVTPDPVVEEGEKVSITCISKGVPSPDNTIIRNGAKVSTEKTSTEVSSEKTSTTYTVDFVTPGDAGIYTCIAENKVGSYSAIRDLTVEAQIPFGNGGKGTNIGLIVGITIGVLAFLAMDL